ncbi:MAG: prepilin-type N-terminal cleavage/methylation domain-containing protein [Mariprofundaceae bacterium]|nr:prepilin-type N-terminal cleavage/methylation domain-containing protein [Mariprofundaceae bacterium]
MKNNGFSLIELMTVMAILSLLTAIGLPGYQSFRVKANNASALSDMHTIQINQAIFYGEHAQYAPYLNTDRSNSGGLNKTINLSAGGTAIFKLLSLNKSVESMVIVDARGQFAIAAVKSLGGNIIIAEELEQATVPMKKTSSATLVASDVPASTSGVDLSSWTVW